MSKTFDGILHFDCTEMSNEYGDSAQSWRRQARLGKVPAIRYRRKWYFNPERVFKVSVKQNAFVGESVNNAKQGVKVDLSDFE